MIQAAEHGWGYKAVLELDLLVLSKRKTHSEISMFCSGLKFFPLFFSTYADKTTPWVET